MVTKAKYSKKRGLLIDSKLALNVSDCDVPKIKKDRKNKEKPLISTNLSRCKWVPADDDMYIAYHDEEWGKPIYDNLKLFEMICLEGQQAGLSWLIILRKREHFQKAFHNFNPKKVSMLSVKDVDALVNNPGIIRHRKKIEAIIQNAKCYLEMEKNKEKFSHFIWKFVDNKPIVKKSDSNDIQTTSPISIEMSNALKKKGFKYVGPTICYAFMQACGLVNDHDKGCFLSTNK